VHKNTVSAVAERWNFEEGVSSIAEEHMMAFCFGCVYLHFCASLVSVCGDISEIACDQP
jgi:hypothetical protein